jgi:hypothetical protein
MSLTDSATKVIYAGDANGGTNTVGQAFDITFSLPAGSTGTDVYGYVVDDVGAVTLLTSNYSVDVNAMHFIYPTVGAVAPLEAGINAVPAGWELVIARSEPMSQTLTLTNNGVIDLPSLEKAFDKVTMICQQLQEQVSRCFKAPINLPYDPISPIVPPAASTLIQYTGTLAQLIVISNASPASAAFGIATDIGSGQLVWYPGYASTNGIQGSGWYAIGGGI